jgi:hypothetical protein
MLKNTNTNEIEPLDGLIPSRKFNWSIKNVPDHINLCLHSLYSKDNSDIVLVFRTFVDLPMSSLYFQNRVERNIGILLFSGLKDSKVVNEITIYYKDCNIMPFDLDMSLPDQMLEKVIFTGAKFTSTVRELLEDEY